MCRDLLLFYLQIVRVFVMLTKIYHFIFTKSSVMDLYAVFSNCNTIVTAKISEINTRGNVLNSDNSIGSTLPFHISQNSLLL